ncbi:hypothetical protein [uncultured Sphingomonas sp.]|uniref:hypothetical protein n=1 Tax=uncultured Sphingomonas sp. TaxID=158754 RepID=UPI0037498458
MRVGSFAQIVIAAGAVLLAPAAAQAGPVRSTAGTVVRAYPDQIAFTYRQSLRSLRTAALQQQQRDGGTLSPDSQRMIQARLDRINARFARALRNNDPLSIDGTGHPRATPTTSDWTNADLFVTGRQ